MVPASAPEPGLLYRVDPGNAQVSFDLRATGHTVHGQTDHVTGQVRAAKTEEAGWELEGEVRVTAASLETGNQRRDRKMRKTSLVVESHPEIVFVPKVLLPGKAGEEGSFILGGALTIRGITLPVTIPVSVEERDGGRLRVAGGTDLRWADYGVPNPSFLFLRVRPTLRIRFQVDWVPEEGNS